MLPVRFKFEKENQILKTELTFVKLNYFRFLKNKNKVLFLNKNRLLFKKIFFLVLHFDW